MVLAVATLCGRSLPLPISLRSLSPIPKERKKENRHPKGRHRRKKERKKENRQPKGGMGGRYTATTQGF